MLTWCSGQRLEILLLAENDYIYSYIYVHLVINIHYRTYRAFFKYKQLQTMLFWQDAFAVTSVCHI